jgi:hypothetical protein
VKKLFTICVWLVAFDLFAGHYKYNAMRTIIGVQVDRYRKINGKISDLNPVFDYWETLFRTDKSPSFDPDPMGEWVLLFGIVSQLPGDGEVLCQKYEDFSDDEKDEYEGEHHLVRLQNFPRESRLVDKDKIACFAHPNGRYSFVSTGGGNVTVESYDFGALPSTQEVEDFKLSQQAEQKQIDAKNRDAEQQNQKAKVEKSKELKLKTFKYYSDEAQKGDGYAQMRLGELYLHGDGVGTNLNLARKWLWTASTNGYPDAPKKFITDQFNQRQ